MLLQTTNGDPVKLHLNFESGYPHFNALVIFFFEKGSENVVSCTFKQQLPARQPMKGVLQNDFEFLTVYASDSICKIQ